MSDITKTIEIIFKGVDNVSSITNKVNSDINNLGSGIQSLTAPLAGAADAVLKYQAALSAMAVAGLAYAFNESKKFESATIELEKVLGSTESADVARKAALALSDTYGESANDILGSTADFRQAGFNLEEAMMITKGSMDLVIAGGIDAAEASELVIRALKGFGFEATEVNRYVDILNHTSNLYATDVRKLGIAMSTLSPIASTMGFSIEETAGLVTPVIEKFQSGEQAAIAFKTGLLRLISGTTKVSTSLDFLGVSQTDVNGNMRSAKEIFYDVAGSMGNLTKEEQIYHVSQLVGIHQSGRLLEAFTNLDKTLEITAAQMDASGSAAAEVAKRLESAEVAVNRFKVGFQNLGIAIGDEFIIAAKGAINGATDIENALRGMVNEGDFDQILDMVNSFANSIGESLSTIAINLPEAFDGVNFDSLTNGLGSVGDAISGVFDGVDLSTPEGLQEVIQLVIDGLGGFQELVAGVITGITPLLNVIGDMAKKFIELDPATQRATGELLGIAKALNSLGTIISAGGALVEGLSSLAGIFSVNGLLIAGLVRMGAALTGPVGVVLALGAFATAIGTAWKAFDNWSMKQMQEEIDKTNASFYAQNEKITEFYKLIGDLPTDVQTVDIYAAVDSGDFEEAKRLIDEATEKEHKIEIIPIVHPDGIADFDALTLKVSKLTGEQQTTFYTEVDIESKKAVDDFFASIEKDKVPVVKPKVDEEAVTEAQKALNKLTQISLQGDIDTQIAQIKASAETAQSAFEWTAKLNIANVEADAEKVKAMFSSIDNSINSTAALIGTALGSLGGFGSIQEKWAAQDVLNSEMDAREDLFDLQEKLVTAELDLIAKKSEAIVAGEGIIKIDSTGLEPALETIMWQIIEKVQIRATADNADFLLGL